MKLKNQERIIQHWHKYRFGLNNDGEVDEIRVSLAKRKYWIMMPLKDLKKTTAPLKRRQVVEQQQVYMAGKC